MFYRFNLLVAGDLSKGLLGKLFGDKAYIFKEFRMNLEHTRHRAPLNFLVHIITCIVSYALTKLTYLKTVYI